MKYVFKYIYFIFALVLLARSAFAHPSCEDQLEPQKPPSESAATASADAKSYLSLVNLYLDKNPDTVLKVSDLIAKSESFINPIENQEGSFALQIANGIERLRKRIDSQAWKQIQAGMLVTKKEKIEVQESKEVAQKETSHLFGATVINELKISGAGDKIFYFQQNGRSYLLTTGRQKSLFLFEVVNDRVRLVKEIERIFHEYDLNVATDENRVYIFQRGWQNNTSGQPQKYILAVSEFINEEVFLLDKISHDTSFAPYTIYAKNDELYFSTKSMLSEMRFYHLKKSFLNNTLDLVSLKSFEMRNATSFEPVLFDVKGSPYLAYDYKEADKRMWRPKWSEKLVRKRAFVVQKIDRGFFEFGVKTYDFELTSSPIAFERDGQHYLAFGATSSGRGTFQIYRFDNGQLVLVNEVLTSGEVKGVQITSGGSFVLISDYELNLAELKENNLAVTSTIRTRNYIKSDARLIKSKGREFVLIGNNVAAPFWSGTYEVDNGALVMAADLKIANYAEVPSTQHPDEVLLAVSRDEKIQLIRLVKTVKVKK